MSDTPDIDDVLRAGARRETRLWIALGVLLVAAGLVFWFARDEWFGGHLMGGPVTSVLGASFIAYGIKLR